jgi:predicted permease
MRPQGYPRDPDGFPRTNWDVVGPGYFTAIGTPVIRGRDFTDRDRVGSPSVIAINEAMARLFFGDANPIGQRFGWGDDTRPLEVIAVVRDVKQSGPREEPRRRFYLPYLQMPQIRDGWVVASTRYLVRSQASPAETAAAVRGVMSAQDSRLSISRLEIGTALVSRTLVQERMVAVLLIAFGVLAVGLACLGLYGVIAYNVVQRTSEIGMRIALGARRADVLWLTLRRGMVWIAAGVVLGVPLALSASRLLEGLLFGLTATDAVSLAGAIALMSAVGLVAAYVPARRASRIDPLVALRGE